MTAAENAAGDKAVCVKSMHLMATGGADEFAEVYAPGAINREAVDEPPAARTGGPEGFHATAQWLREAYSDIRWEVHDAVQDGDLVAVHATMSGRQTGPFTAYADDASVEMVFPSRGREFAVTQTHWFRMEDGKIAEHWANRDDLTLGQQLGWTPPTPIYLAKMLLAKRQAQPKKVRR